MLLRRKRFKLHAPAFDARALMLCIVMPAQHARAGGSASCTGGRALFLERLQLL
jgi:hypothetical protein